MEWAAPTWGEVGDDELRRIVVVSPHLDDAARGAAHVIASHPDVTVITVMGGQPPSYPDPPTDWDARGGFAAGDDVVGVRREEDRAAMDLLGATPVWLPFVDHQYLAPRQRATSEEVSAALTAAVAQAGATAVFVPMGLANPDHVVTHDAARLVIDELPGLSWFAYQDAGYTHLPGMLAWRVGALFRSGLWPTPAMVPIEPDEDLKRAAIERYASQLPPLVEDHALADRLGAHVAEQYWRLAPPPAGWEGLAEL